MLYKHNYYDSKDLNIKNVSDFLKVLEEHEIQYVDFNFTDMRGKWQHTAQHVDSIDKDTVSLSTSSS